MKRLLSEAGIRKVASRRIRDSSARGKDLPWVAEITHGRFSSLLVSITDGLVVLNREWRYVYVNSAAEHLLGMGRDELLGRVVWEVYPGELGTTRERESRRAVRENTPVVLENYWIPTGRGLRQVFTLARMVSSLHTFV